MSGFLIMLVGPESEEIHDGAHCFQRWLPSVPSGDPTSKLFDPALCFCLRGPVQVVFFRLNYHHFFFFRLNYHPDFYSSLKSLYVHQIND
jgi:hypothetical protein